MEDDEVTGSHARSAAGRVPRRAMFSAWAVFLSMAGTTMTFQVFHAIRYGGMPWELAVLYGVIPLAISVGVLDFVAEWEDAPGWAAWAAYAITAGAMFLSAAATGSVVLHAAPHRLSGLFGLLLDAAALLSVRFILTAPRKAREKAAAEAARQEAAARAEAGQVAVLTRELEAARAAHQADVSELRAQFGRELEAMSARQNAAVSDLHERLDEAVSARENDQVKLAEALKRAESAERKVATMDARKARNASAEDKSKTAQATAGDGDLTTELRALMELKADPGLRKPRMGGELARRLGISASHGRRFHGQFTSDGELSEAAEALIKSLPGRP